jgi:hypothetical protein
MARRRESISVLVASYTIAFVDSVDCREYAPIAATLKRRECWRVNERAGAALHAAIVARA